jgi:outer membrane receptor for ferric coprogen and ferric-rhodotorulic acid
MTGETTAMLERARHASGNVTQLGPVRVAGDAGSATPVASVTSDPNATEGTGSYTIRQTGGATRLNLSPAKRPSR